MATNQQWDLSVGDTIRRTDLHARFGGRRQGGIGPSAQTPNVFLFTDPAVGQQHGYYDGWSDDGTFDYTGEGQRGDQQLTQGNLAIANHIQDRRALRLFRGVGGEVLYLGEFTIALAEPYYRMDAPETGGGPLREVLVFRLVPVGDVVHEAKDSRSISISGPRVRQVEIEALNTETFLVAPSKEPITAERTEQKLVIEYREFLRSRGSTVVRHQYIPEGEHQPLFCDLFDTTRQHLLEAKGSDSREAVRMAIGQLTDYKRFEGPGVRTAVLLPRRPRKDLEGLAASAGVAVVWKATDSQFDDNDHGRFT